MIVTVTANPSVDRTVVLPGPLRRGAVQRAEAVLEHPGGKGVNISRACVASGVPTLALLPVADDDPFVAELAAVAVPFRPVPPAGPMRVNLTLTEPDGTTTKINSAGATVADLSALADAAADAAAAGDWVVLAGSLPPGVPDDWYADLAARLHGLGVRVAVDASEGPLLAVTRAGGAAVGLLKPNAEELASVTGSDPDALEADPERAADAAATLVGSVATTVLATLGAGGAVLVDASGAWHAVPPPITVASTVGAGDATLFGYLAADLRGLAPAERLASAVAYGAAAASLPGTTAPTPSDVRTAEVRVRALDVPSRVTTTEGKRS
ncbi:MAG TPA: hexose kinase [Nocardioides sp.]|nr:hexose kinase [Nocardioides sp.]